MKIIRVQNPIGIDYMEDFFVDDDMSKETLGASLKSLLEKDLDNTFVLQAWDGDSLVAFLIAFNLPAQTHVFLYQAWVEYEYSIKVSDKMFFRLLLWTDFLGKDEVRMETVRSEDAITKKWKFEKYSTIMTYKIPEDFEFSHVEGKRIADVTPETEKTKEIKDIPKKGISSETEEQDGKEDKAKD